MDSDLYIRNILDFASYEEYLDQQVTPEDLFYLEDREAARRVVELGYKGKDFLSRDEFEAARLIARHGPEKRRESAEAILSATRRLEPGTLLDAIAKREELVRTGKLATILFIRDYVNGQEVSAYIDLAHRFITDNFEEYFDGTKRLLPKRSDLSYYNWKTHTLYYNNSTSFQVITESRFGLLMKHKRDRKIMVMDPKAPTPGDSSNRTIYHCKDYLQVTIYDHVTRFKS
ncbi:unnamed protein product [Phytomonas sp. Hart1]|nr:unnamed protein product [Phytomonas sp. Hart1]|eukprot:CCW66680.1 unnamed protein product [Phytomonas sp. isolate Hart1]